MSTAATAILQLATTGDVIMGPENFAAAVNTASPAQTQLVTLSSGDNSISMPSATCTRITITKPAGNTVALAFGAGGTFPLHLTDWDSFSSSLAQGGTFVINAASTVTVRLTYT